MKTNNIFTKCVVIAVIFLISVSANAQTQNERANFNDQAVVATIVADSLMGTGCALVTAHVENSLVDRVDAKIHSGFYGVLTADFSSMDLNSTDKGKGQTNSIGGELTLGFDYCKRTWPAAIGVEASLGGYSNTEIEKGSTKAFTVQFKVPVTFMPHGTVSFQVYPMLGYRNVTSSTDINTEYLEGDVSGHWNGFQLGGGGNLLITLFHVKSTKYMDVAGQKVKAVKHRPVRLVLGAEYSHMNVDKPIINGQANKLSINELILKAGFKVTF